MYADIDVEALRRAVRDECLGAAFGGGFGGALMEACDADTASPEELVDMARDCGVDLRRFIVD